MQENNSIKMEMSINIDNPKHVNAALAFFQTLAGQKVEGETLTVERTTEPQEEAEQPKTRRKRRTKAEIAADKAKEEEATAAEETEEKEESSISMDDLIVFFSEKMKTHRNKKPEMKAKLEELGVAKVSQLKGEQLDIFKAFLDTL